MNALTFSGHTAAGLIQDLDAEMAGGFRPTLAFVFQSSVLDHSALQQPLHERGISVVGMTTSGEIEGANVAQDSFSVMALELAPGTFEARLYSDDDNDTLEQKSHRLGQFAAERFGSPVVFAFASGIGVDGEEIVRGVAAGAERPITLYGGLAADDLKMQATYVFTGEGISGNGLVGLVLDGSRYEATALTTSGWQSVGVEKVVTHVEGNVVHTIDGVPALEVYQQYFDVGSQSGTSVAMDIGVQYPLLVRRDNGDAVIRAPLMAVQDTPSLVFSGAVPQGARVRFCIPPSLEIVEQVVDEASEMQREVPDADALVLISCAARLTALGPMIEDEVQGISDLWSAPLAGFFAYGEIGPTASGGCDFHNETCTLVALREITA